MKPIKIKAFSLLEVLVALTISTILFGLVGSAYFIILENYHKYKFTQEVSYDTYTLHRLLFMDMDKSNYVNAMGQGHLMYINFKDTVSYEFQDELVIRKAQMEDTFFVKLDEVNFSYKNTNVSLGVVDQLSFSCANAGKSNFYFYKNYGADVLINYHEY